MPFVSCQCGVKYSLSVLKLTLTISNGFDLLSSILMHSLDPVRDKSGHVCSLGHGPEPILDVDAA